MTEIAEGSSSNAVKGYSSAETEALKKDLLDLYSTLHNKDRNHKRKPVEWLEFENKAREYLEKKKALVEADNSNSINVNARCTRETEVQISDMGDTPDQAAANQLGDDDLIVPEENDPAAKQQNDAYLQIVLKQANTFEQEKSEFQGKLQEVAKDIQKFGARIKKFFGFGLPMAAWVPFSDADPCWVKAMIVAMDRLFTDRAKFYIVPTNVHDVNNLSYTYPLPEKQSGPLRVCIVGDIGTNDKIHKNTLKAIKALNSDIILHLGDIYICGTEEECEEFWNVYESVYPSPKSRPPLFSIPGNHEYIDAGCGFFNKLVSKQRLGYATDADVAADVATATTGAASTKRPQSTSYFELLSSKFNLQILGLDTGYNSKNFTLPFGGEQMDYSTSLNPEEACWAQTRLRQAKASGMNTIMLTHHQFFSAGWKNKVTNAKLGHQIFQAEQPITAWLWGHEHRIGVYDAISTEEVKIAACLGHGAMPEYGKDSYSQPDSAVHKFDPAFTPDSEKVYRNFDPIYNSGFAILEVHDATNIEMICYQVNRRTGNCTEKGRRKIV